MDPQEEEKVNIFAHIIRERFHEYKHMLVSGSRDALRETIDKNNNIAQHGEQKNPDINKSNNIAPHSEQNKDIELEESTRDVPSACPSSIVDGSEQSSTHSIAAEDHGEVYDDVHSEHVCDDESGVSHVYDDKSGVSQHKSPSKPRVLSAATQIQVIDYANSVTRCRLARLLDHKTHNTGGDVYTTYCFLGLISKFV